MTLEAEGNSKVTFSDLPVSKAVAWVGKMPHHSTLTFGGELNHPTYLDIPSFYLIAKNDRIIRPEMQRSLVDAASELKESSNHGVCHSDWPLPVHKSARYGSGGREEGCQRDIVNRK